MQSGMATSVGALIDAAVRGGLDEAQTLRLCGESPEPVVLALLAAAQRIAEQEARIAELQKSPAEGGVPEHGIGAACLSTPSGMVPVYSKPNTPRRHKKPGSPNGHPGARRARPARIDHRQVHRLKRCPHYGGRVQRCQQTRTRLIEDIPEDVRTEVTKHTIHRDHCPQCKKDVEPVVPEAMPGATVGHRLVALTVWFHYGLGITIAQIVDILGYHLQMPLTPGGMIDA